VQRTPGHRQITITEIHAWVSDDALRQAVTAARSDESTPDYRFDSYNSQIRSRHVSSSGIDRLLFMAGRFPRRFPVGRDRDKRHFNRGEHQTKRSRDTHHTQEHPARIIGQDQRRCDMAGTRPVRKEYWHPLHLQSLPTDSFVRVVSEILQGQLTLIRMTPEASALPMIDSELPRPRVPKSAA